MRGSGNMHAVAAFVPFEEKSPAGRETDNEVAIAKTVGCCRNPGRRRRFDDIQEHLGTILYRQQNLIAAVYLVQHQCMIATGNRHAGRYARSLMCRKVAGVKGGVGMLEQN